MPLPNAPEPLAPLLSTAWQPSGWHEFAPVDDALTHWLLHTDASLFQYPFWNEPLRQLHLQPRYLGYGACGQLCAWVCVLTLGGPWGRIGLIQRGPVVLVDDPVVLAAAVDALSVWAAHQRYLFLRYTHAPGPLAAHVATMPCTEQRDPFPLYRDLGHELLVPLAPDAAQMLRGFQSVARRKIARAQQAGYSIDWSDTPAALGQVWPLFEALAARKGFRFRPRKSYLALVAHARRYGCVRIYTAALQHQCVAAILVLRDRTTAHYISGALDTQALGNKPSPACLLHWQAICDHAALGAQCYNLGTRSGAVYQFKRQFRPREQHNPAPTTLVLDYRGYRLWLLGAERTEMRLRPLLKRLLAR